MHTPKTAGTSFRQFLEQRFHADEVLEYWYPSEILRCSPLSLARYKLICGHYTYALVSCLPRRPLLITLFRDPVEQVLSLFSDLKRNGGLPDDLTFERCLETEQVQRFVNLQTRWLASEIITGHSLGYDTPYTARHQALGELTDRRLLDLALERFRELACFGIVEAMPESMLLVCYTFGWNPGIQLSYAKVASERIRRHQLSRETLGVLEAITELDGELYAHAVNAFQQRLRAVTAETAREAYEHRLARSPQVPTLRFSFDKPVDGTGWHDREKMPDGTYACWTGPQTVSTLDLPLDQSRDLVVAARVLSCLCPSALKSLTLKINGHSVPIRKWLPDENVKTEGVVTGILQKEWLRSSKGFVRLELEIDRTIRANSVDPSSSDDRALGLMFNWLEFFPANNRSAILSADTKVHEAYRYDPFG